MLRIAAFLLLHLALPSAGDTPGTATAESLRVGSRTFTRCTITLDDPATARIVHADGIARIAAAELPENIRSAIGFDHPAAEAATALAGLDALDLTFETVKQLDGKFRYFFRLRNAGSEPWNKPLSFKLLAQVGHEIPDAAETLLFTRPLRPGGFGRFWIDTRLGTPRTHGEYGADRVTITLGSLDTPEDRKAKPFRTQPLQP